MDFENCVDASDDTRRLVFICAGRERWCTASRAWPTVRLCHRDILLFQFPPFIHISSFAGYGLHFVNRFFALPFYRVQQKFYQERLADCEHAMTSSSRKYLHYYALERSILSATAVLMVDRNCGRAVREQQLSRAELRHVHCMPRLRITYSMEGLLSSGKRR